MRFCVPVAHAAGCAGRQRDMRTASVFRINDPQKYTLCYQPCDPALCGRWRNTRIDADRGDGDRDTFQLARIYVEQDVPGCLTEMTDTDMAGTALAQLDDPPYHDCRLEAVRPAGGFMQRIERDRPSATSQ